MPIQTNCVACNSLLNNPILSNIGILCPTCSNQGLFRKSIIITGITRMRGEHICVSGLDPKTWRFIRPVFIEGRLSKDFAIEGSSQTFRLFDEVEMEFNKYNPSPIYHTEDWIVNRNFAPRYIKHLNNEEIVKILDKMSITNLSEAFERQDKSVFIVKTRNIFNVTHEYYDKFKVRISFYDWSGNLFERIPVVDLLLLAKAQYMISKREINWKQQTMDIFNNNPFRYIRIGTTREWRGQYWKQVSALITVPDMFDGEAYIDYRQKNGVNI